MEEEEGDSVVGADRLVAAFAAEEEELTTLPITRSYYFDLILVSSYAYSSFCEII